MLNAHPDKNHDFDTTEEAKKLNEARDTLFFEPNPIDYHPYEGYNPKPYYPSSGWEDWNKEEKEWNEKKKKDQECRAKEWIERMNKMGPKNKTFKKKSKKSSNSTPHVSPFSK